MKLLLLRRFSVFTIIFTVFVFFAGVFSVVHAANEKIVVLRQDEVINNDYFAAGDMVTVSGTVNGDVYAAGGEVMIDGVVNGDVIAAGGKVVVRGQVSQNIRVAGGEVEVSGEIGRNVTVAGGNVTFSDAAKIDGSLVVAGGDVSINAPVAKDIHAGAGDLSLGSQVNGNMVLAVGSLNLSKDAAVAGNLEYYSEEEGIIPEGAVAGQVVRKQSPVNYNKDDSRESMDRFALASKFIRIVGAFVIGLILLKLAPTVSLNAVNQIKSYPWRNLAIGLLILIVTPITAVLLLISMVGAPLALILMALYFVSIYLSGIFIAMFVGQFILNYFKKSTTKEISLFLGVVVYTLLTMIPFVGWFVSFVSMLIGLGALIVAERRLHLDRN
jgi:cytoskeletal protein CcmA (bactofilin family)